MGRCRRLALMVLTWLMIIPPAVYAQASITGVVRDTSGAVLPGVTVEAASPALIEKVRSVVTGTGQYRIENLPPGTYGVTSTRRSPMGSCSRLVETSTTRKATPSPGRS
jgi:hypothetical protein